MLFARAAPEARYFRLHDRQMLAFPERALHYNHLRAVNLLADLVPLIDAETPSATVET